MTQDIIQALQHIVGSDFVLTDDDKKRAYLYDEIELNVRPVADSDVVVVKPENTAQISAVMKLASEKYIPVVTRGGGTGLCGGCTPTVSSIVLSMERLNRIVEIDKRNMCAVLEGGVTLGDLLAELNKYPGLGFPVHPGDEGAHFGGMAATNAGGARAVRHGVMRKHIMGLEAVLADGEVLNLGGKLIKDNAGYNLTQLLIGSEGTLAVITKVILKLYPEEKYTCTIIASFNTFDDASQTVLDLLESGTTPLAVEYMDKLLFVETAKMLGKVWPLPEGLADLMIILSESDENRFHACLQSVRNICLKNKSCEPLYAGKKSEQEEILLIRSQHYEYVKHLICHSFDMAVPVGSAPAFLRELKDLQAYYQTTTNVIAHIADGNFHNDIIYVNGEEPAYAEEYKLKMYEACFRYGGTITGEHGVGKLRAPDLKLQKSPRELALMRGIKELFDPRGLLNPGTVLEYPPAQR